MKLQIQVCGAQAKLTASQGKLTTGMVGAEVEFSFDDAWNDLKKIAIFRAGSIVADVECVDTVVEIPVEVLQQPKQILEVGVYGYNDSGELVIPTVYVKACAINEGADPNGNISTSLPIYARLQKGIDDLKAFCVGAINDIRDTFLRITGGKLTGSLITRDVRVGGDIDEETGEWNPGAGGGKSRLAVSGTLELHGEVKAENSSFKTHHMNVGGEMKVAGDSTLDGTVRVNDSLKVKSELEVGGRLKMKNSSTIDVGGGDVKNVQSLEVEGTANLLNDVKIKNNTNRDYTIKLSDALNEALGWRFKNRFDVSKFPGEDLREKIVNVLAAAEGKDCTIYIPSGEYIWNSPGPITISGYSVSFVGDPRTRPVITANITGWVNLLVEVTGAGSVSFENLEISRGTGTSSDVNLISGTYEELSAGLMVFKRCKLYQTGVGFSGVKNVLVEECEIDTLAGCISHSARSGNIPLENLIIKDSKLKCTYNYESIMMGTAGSYSLSIIDSTLSGGRILWAEAMGKLVVVNSVLSSVRNIPHIFIKSCGQVFFERCHFDGIGGSAYCVIVDGKGILVFIGCTHVTLPPYGLYVRVDGKEMSSLDDYIHSPAAAEVGQTIVAKAVDDAGKPTEWGTVSLPTTLHVVITYNPDDGTATANKTYEEIIAAYNNGSTITCQIDEPHAPAQVSGVMLVDTNENSAYVTGIGYDDGKTWLGLVGSAGAAVLATPTAIPAPETAAVDQIPAVEAVDENGKPTAWKMVELPSGGSGGGEWELIRSLTLEEDVASVSVTTDDAGSAFSLREMRVTVTMPTDAKALWYFYFAPNLANYAVKDSTTSQWIAIHAYANDPIVDIRTSASGAPVYATKFSDTISMFEMKNFSSVLLPAGTTVRIMGVRG